MIDRKIYELGYRIDSMHYKIDSIELAKKVCKNLELTFIDFCETKICGILYKSEKTTSMALNTRRSAIGKNFDCMHELIHYWFHEPEEFFCRADVYNHMEWQANEGAAQFLMPHQSFAPNYRYLSKKLGKIYSGERLDSKLVEHLSIKYFVGELAVRYRINTLMQMGAL